MRARFTQGRPTPDLARLFEAEDLADPSGVADNVAPTQPIAVVAEHADRRALTAYRWGLVPPWAPDPKVGGRMIDARAETVDRSPGWSPG